MPRSMWGRHSCLLVRATFQSPVSDSHTHTHTLTLTQNRSKSESKSMNEKTGMPAPPACGFGEHPCSPKVSASDGTDRSLLLQRWNPSAENIVLTVLRRLRRGQAHDPRSAI